MDQIYSHWRELAVIGCFAVPLIVWVIVVRCIKPDFLQDARDGDDLPSDMRQ